MKVPRLSQLSSGGAQPTGTVEQPAAAGAAATAPASDAKWQFFHIEGDVDSLTRTIHHSAFQNYFMACAKSIQECAEELLRTPGYVRVWLELLPSGGKLVTVGCVPTATQARVLSQIAEVLMRMPVPPVTDRLRWVLQVAIHGGSEAPPRFDAQTTYYRLATEDFAFEPAPEETVIAKGIRNLRKFGGWLRAACGMQPRDVKSNQSAAHGEGAKAPPEWDDKTDVDQLTALLQAHPDEAGLYEARGVQRLKRGEPKLALRDFDELQRLAPNDQSTYLRRVQANWRAENLSGALREVNRGLDVCGPTLALLIGRSEIYFALEAWDAALRDLDQAAALEPRDANLYYWRSRIQFCKGSADAAVADLRTALECDPYAANALTTLGAMLADQAEGPASPLLDEAAKLLDRAVWLSPRDVNYLLARAQIRAKQGQLESAVADCDAAIQSEPEHGYAWHLRGATRLRFSQAAPALTDLTKAIELGHVTADAHTTRATAHYMLGDLNSALADANAALALEEGHFGALALRGRLQLALGSTQAAFDDLDAALAAVPNNAVWLVDRGHARRGLGDNRRALLDYSRAIELDDTLALAYANRALCWLDQQRVDDASTDLDRAISLQPDVPVGVYLQRGQLRMLQGQLELAHADFEYVVRTAPGQPAGYYERGRVLTQLGRLTEARADLDRVIELDPQGNAYLTRATLFIRDHQDRLADADFQAATESNPEFAELYQLHRELVEIGRAQAEERYDAGIEQATAILSDKPDCVSARMLRASCYWYAEHFVEAIDDLTQCIEQSPDFLIAVATRGQVLADAGEYAQALEDLDHAIQKSSGNETLPIVAYAHRGRGVALLGLGRLDEAIQELESSISSCPENAWAQYSLGLYYVTTNQPREAAQCLRLALALDRPRLTPRQRARATALVNRSQP